MPPKLKPLYDARERLIYLEGGRGSAKSWAVAYTLLDRGLAARCRMLCTREIQNTIKDSVHKLLSDRIYEHGLDKFYEIKNDSIIGRNGTEFIFKGLLRNIQDIKSIEGIDYCWIEEAQSVSRRSLEVLIPTIRKENSQIFYTYNPVNDDDPVYVDSQKTDRIDQLKIISNYYDNPWFPAVLKNEMEYDRAHDSDKYFHVWEGHPVKHSKAQIFFGKWVVDDFDTPRDADFLFGADWGFANDPVALVRSYIQGGCLFIDHEIGGVGIDINEYPGLFAEIEESDKYPIIADSARPETISYVKKRGFPLMRASVKGPGSIEDGISFIRSFDKIVIHPRCRKTIDEFRLYCYKIHPLTGDVTNKIEDKHNHYIDALRYSLEKFYLKSGRELQDRFGIQP